MDTIHGLLFGVLALQMDLIDPTQLVEVCVAWARRKETPLIDLLLERGWITPQDKADLERLAERKLKNSHGDARASLTPLVNERVRSSLAAIADPDIYATVVSLAKETGQGPLPPPPLPLSRERYTLTHVHAVGGIGRVWLAQDLHLGRAVALKELRADRAEDPANWACFLKEARVTGQLEHPGIVPIYELARRPENQQPFYTMRFIKGRTLSEAVAAYHKERRAGTAGQLELRGLLTAFVQVCQTVAYAHSRGVIHRDLKGQNVVLGDFGEVIVLDWGLAKVLGAPDGEADAPPVVVNQEGEPPRTVQGQVLGTPAYMAPEQAVGQTAQIGPATDIFGLGAIVYEILTGRPPFAGADTLEVLEQAGRGEPMRPRQVMAAVPRALEAVCLRALAKDPPDRYASARLMAEEVQHWLADQPVQAYQEPLSGRLSRWARQHRPMVAGVGALLVTAVVALSISTVLIGKARAVAEANYRRAHDAVDQSYTIISENQLLNRPGLQPLRRELLQTARNYYEQFVAERGHDPAARTDLALAYFRLGLLTKDLGSPNEAIQLLLQARDLFAHLVGARGEYPDYKNGLGRCHDQLGNLYYEVGQQERAQENYREALVLLEELAYRHPGEARYQTALAKCVGNIGTLSQARGKGDEAEKAYERTRELFADLASKNPRDPEYRSELARSLSNLATLYSARGRRKEAIQAQLRAIELRQELVSQDKEAIDYQYNLAQSHLNLGVLYEEHREAGKALQANEEAFAALDKLVRHNPAMSNFQRDLATCANNLGVLYRRRDRKKEAEQVHQRALQIAERLVEDYPGVHEYQYLLGQSLMKLGQVYQETNRLKEAAGALQNAVARLRQLVDAHGDLLEFRLELAAAHGNQGLLAEAQRDQAAAIAAYTAMIGCLEPVRHQALSHAQFRNFLCSAYWYRAEMRTKAARLAEALDDWNQALQLGEESQRAIFCVGRALTRARMGDHARAAQEADEEARRTGVDNETLYNLVVVYALSAAAAREDSRLARHYSQRALEILKRLGSKGFFTDAKNRADLDKNGDLQALRLLPEFKEFEAAVRKNDTKK
jgi:serine/threonine-protein kinase